MGTYLAREDIPRFVCRYGVAGKEGLLSLAQAAKVTGKSKPTVPRAIKAGKLSASRRDNGRYKINPAELARVFLLAGDLAARLKHDEPHNGVGSDPLIAGLRALLPEREARIADTDSVIDDDLRRRLDQATALLTDERSAAPAPLTGCQRFLAWRRGR